MQTLTLFYLENCPHCKKAQQLIDQLIAENPDFGSLKIVKIEESKEPELANQYDYFYVPTFYVGDKKLHEGTVNKSQVQQILQSALR